MLATPFITKLQYCYIGYTFRPPSTMMSWARDMGKVPILGILLFSWSMCFVGLFL